MYDRISLLEVYLMAIIGYKCFDKGLLCLNSAQISHCVTGIACVALAETHKVVGLLAVKGLKSGLQIYMQILYRVIILHTEWNVKFNTAQSINYFYKSVKVYTHKVVNGQTCQKLYLLNAKLFGFLEIALADLLCSNTDCGIYFLIISSNKNSCVTWDSKHTELACFAVEAGKHNCVASHTAFVNTEKKNVYYPHI